MPEPQKKPVETLFGEIHKFIEHNQQKLNKGDEIDITGLEKEVESLCRQVQAMNAEDSQKYKTRLESLFAELSDLGNRLIHNHAVVAKQISNLSLRQKATVAYMKSDMMEPKTKPEQDT